MYKLAHVRETLLCQSYDSLPPNVQCKINEVLTILDDCYGADRDMLKDSGGYVVVLESAEDVNTLKDLIHVNLAAEIFEYVDAVSGYLGCLLLLGTEYHLYFVLQQSLAPPNVLNQIGA